MWLYIGHRRVQIGAVAGNVSAHLDRHEKLGA
jgi:hypothetical protein